MITQEDIKPILGGVQKALSFSTLEPFIAIAKHRFIAEFGQQLYSYLDSNPSGQQDLVSLAKSLMLWQAYSISQPHIHVRIGDGGMVKNSPQNTIALTKWEYVKLEESNISMVDFYYEAFYQLLDQVNPSVYASSPNFIARNELTLNTAHLFTKSFPLLNNSVRLFNKLKPYIRLTESSLKQRFTPEVFTALSSSIQHKHNLHSLIAHLSVYESLPYLTVIFDSEGLRVVEKTDSTRNEVQASETKKTDLRHKLYNDSKLTLENIMQHLYSTSSPTVYPTFYNTFVLDSMFNTSQDNDPAASPIL